MDKKLLDKITFKEFLLDAVSRFQDSSITILKVLGKGIDGNDESKPTGLNMDEISISAKINRSSIATSIAPLEVLGLVELARQGQAKVYSITDIGLEVLSVLREREING